MKRLLFTLLFLLGFCNLSFALITTDNVDVDRFQYEIPYRFATGDIAASKTREEIPAVAISTPAVGDYSHVYYYVIPRGGSDTLYGRIVGLAVAGNNTATAGSATFDVTVNGTITGIKAVVEAGPARSAIGVTGSSGTQYSYIRQWRDDSRVAQGLTLGDSANNHDSYISSEKPYGNATPLSAGDRIGVAVTTSSNWATTSNVDYAIVVYVLE